VLTIRAEASGTEVELRGSSLRIKEEVATGGKGLFSYKLTLIGTSKPSPPAWTKL